MVLAAAATPSLADTLAANASTASAQKGYAGASFGSPLAFGMNFGAVSAGGYTQTQKGFANLADASIGLTVGLGDPNRYVGVDASAVFATILKSKGSSAGFGEVGSLSVKFSRNLDPATAVGFGINGVYFYGFTKELEQPVYFANGSHIFSVGSGEWRRPLVTNLGIVASGFEDSLNSRNKTIVRPFGSVAYYLYRQVSLIVDYNGRYGNAGLSIAPFARFPATVTLGAINLNDNDGQGTQFGVAVSIAGRFFNP